MAVVLLTVAGCMSEDGGVVLHGPDPQGAGSVSLALSSTEGTLALDEKDKVAGFKVRMFREPPESWDEAAYFQSDCNAASSAFKVDHLKTGTDYVIVYEGYRGKRTGCGAGEPCKGPDGQHPYGQRSDAFGTWNDCTACDRCLGPDQEYLNGVLVQGCLCEPDHLVELGLRGDITISEAGTGEAFYYVQVNRNGAFTGFPMPGPDLTGTTTCLDDADCQKMVDCVPGEDCIDGKKYLVHPKAVCDSGVCSLMSLFPLNTREPRAFHAAVATDDGVVGILGGFNVVNANQLAVNEPEDEAFDAVTSLFFEPVVAGLDQPRALPLIVPMHDGNVAFLGGTSLVKGFPWVFVPGSKECEGKTACTLDLSSRGYVVDVAGGVAEPYTLPVSVVGGQGALVGVPGGREYLFLRPGLVQDSINPADFGTDAWLFAVGDDSSLACANIADGGDPGDTAQCKPLDGVGELTPRVWAVGACIDGDDGTCSEFVILGGTVKADDAFGEVYLAEVGDIKQLTGGGSLPPTLIGATAVVVEGRIWTFGGITGNGGPDAGPMVFDINELNATVSAVQSPIPPKDREMLSRVFHQATLLKDGRSVLVSGGYGAGDTVLDSWVLVELDGNNAKVVDSGTLTIPRLGHAATLIQGGLLHGSVLVTGGLSSISNEPALYTGAELYLSVDHLN